MSCVAWLVLPGPVYIPPDRSESQVHALAKTLERNLPCVDMDATPVVCVMSVMLSRRNTPIDFIARAVRK